MRLFLRRDALKEALVSSIFSSCLLGIIVTRMGGSGIGGGSGGGGGGRIDDDVIVAEAFATDNDMKEDQGYNIG
jgi:hypothetical protein